MDPSVSRTSSLLEFLGLVSKLKHMPRTGWVLRNVKKPETISGHMYRMAMMTFLIDESTSNLDRLKCMEMSLVHDLGESIIGDITPRCGISKADKANMELEAQKTIKNLCGKPGDRIYELFLEYEKQETAEAKFVKELDLFDMFLQAYEYEQIENSPGRLQEFFNSTAGKFSHPLIVPLVDEVNNQRKISLNNSTDV